MNKKIHIDYAANDPRSVAAMLRGRGDGREKLFRLYQALRRLRGESDDPFRTMREYSMAVKNRRKLRILKAALCGTAVGCHAAGIGGVFLLLRHAL